MILASVVEWPTIIAAVLSGGGAAGFVAFKKLPAERDSIIVSAAEGVVVIQQKALEDLREQLTALERKQAASSEEAAQERAAAAQDRRAAAVALAECHDERDELRTRLGQIEQELGNLRQQRRPGSARTRRTDRT